MAIRALADHATDTCVGVGFSAGGTILWQAALDGLPLGALFGVSSTRLRELPALSVPNHVFFGAKDLGKPTAEWLAEVPGQVSIFEGAGHDFYRDLTGRAAQEVRAALTHALRCFAPA